MGLNYDYSKCADKTKVIDTVSPDSKGGFKIDPAGEYTQLKPFAEAILFAMMPCGINTVTEATVDEVYTRLNMYETSRGAMRRRDTGGVYITLDEVKALVGLRTNISSMTKNQFHANLIRIIREESTRTLYTEKHKEPA